MKETINDFTADQDTVIIGIYKALDENEQEVYKLYNLLVDATLNGSSADEKQSLLDSMVMTCVSLCDLKNDLDNADLRWDTICA